LNVTNKKEKQDQLRAAKAASTINDMDTEPSLPVVPGPLKECRYSLIITIPPSDKPWMKLTEILRKTLKFLQDNTTPDLWIANWDNEQDAEETIVKTAKDIPEGKAINRKHFAHLFSGYPNPKKDKTSKVFLKVRFLTEAPENYQSASMKSDTSYGTLSKKKSRHNLEKIHMPVKLYVWNPSAGSTARRKPRTVNYLLKTLASNVMMAAKQQYLTNQHLVRMENNHIMNLDMKVDKMTLRRYLMSRAPSLNFLQRLFVAVDKSWKGGTYTIITVKPYAPEAARALNNMIPECVHEYGLAADQQWFTNLGLEASTSTSNGTQTTAPPRLSKIARPAPWLKKIYSALALTGK
jgi:hypothetical protein